MNRFNYARLLSLLFTACLGVVLTGASCQKTGGGGGGGGAVNPVINLSQSSLNFNTGASGPDPAAQTVNLTNTGSGTTLRWVTTSNQPWLAVTPLNGETTTGTSVLSIRPHVFATEQWNAATATAGAPSAREDFSAAWTGTEMIVWGGYNGAVLGDGSRYNPATNIWTAVTNVGAPAARRYHSAVWTGSRMMVWGGTNGSDTPVNDGAFYDPATNTWTGATTTLNAPAARRSHSAVWTGREMIVWNGLDKIDVGSGGLVLNDGKRYNPVTDTWSVAGLPTANAPTGRYAHKAVWTGTEMIVWSGYNVIEGYMNTGGRFNPTTNTWSATPVSTVGAPAARAYPALVWSGAEMLAWGGTPGGPGMQSGGRYNPTTNSWAPITTTGSPGGSRELEGVWTGSEMIAWGGNTGSGYLNTGGRYQPPAGLTIGSYTGTVTVSDPAATNNPQTITVNLTVSTPSLSVSTSAINYTVATDTIPTFTVTNTTAGTLNWTMTSDQSWLVPPASGTTVAGTPTTVTPGFHFTRKAAGTYTATLTVTAPGALNSPQTIAVTLVVTPIDSFVASATYLRTLYVSTTGNDTTGDGSVGAPFRTLHAACLVAQPGDTIQMLAGSFAGWPIGVPNLALNGTFANPIKIQGDPAGGTQINCALNSAVNGIRLTSSKFVLIQDLKIVGFSDHGVSLDGNLSGSPRGHHIILRKLTVQNGLATANEGIRLFEVDSSIVEECDIDLAVGSGVSAPLAVRHGFHDIVRNNYVHDSFRCGIKVRTQSRDLLIIGNKLENIADRGIELDGFRNAAVANLMVNVFSPLVFEAAEEPLAANNTIYRARQIVLWFSTPVGDPYITRNGRVVNNIFVFNNAELNNYANSGAGTFPATFAYENNLWYSLDSPGFTGPTLAAPETGGKYQVNPQFGDVAGGDFHLALASGARASGLTLTDVPRDFDGFLYATPRALGAFEAPPALRVLDLTPAPGSTGPAPVEVDVDCNNNVSAGTVSGASVFVTGSGGDSTFSDGNEVTIVPNGVAVNGVNAKQIVIDLSGVSMPADTYRVTVTAAVTDTNANGLDGEFSGTFPSGNSVVGGDFTATFVVP